MVVPRLLFISYLFISYLSISFYSFFFSFSCSLRSFLRGILPLRGVPTPPTPPPKGESGKNISNRKVFEFFARRIRMKNSSQLDIHFSYKKEKDRNGMRNFEQFEALAPVIDTLRLFLSRVLFWILNFLTFLYTCELVVCIFQKVTPMALLSGHRDFLNLISLRILPN